jgi:hypothetical protein
MAILLGLTDREYEGHYPHLKQQEVLILWQSITS